MKKLMNKKGESLIESLVAILIFTLSSILLFTMLTTATDLNRAAKEADAAHQAQMVYAEQAESPDSTNNKVTFTLLGKNPSDNVDLYSRSDVNIYRLDANALFAYALD